MDELGLILQEARENKGLTLAEVQEETRINAAYLEALENGEYAALPSPVHVRGSILIQIPCSNDTNRARVTSTPQ